MVLPKLTVQLSDVEALFLLILIGELAMLRGPHFLRRILALQGNGLTDRDRLSVVVR